MSPADICIAEGARLRSLGFNPIPCLNAIGHCPIPHTEFRDNGMPADEFNRVVRDHHAHGIQVANGVRWRLAVLDVDGDLGASVWESWSVWRDCPATVTGRTPRDGWQFFYRVPDGVTSLPSGDLWKGNGDHQGIEILGDRKLARVAPSYKTIDGIKVPYRWVAGRDPGSFPMAVLPRWVLDHLAAGPARSLVVNRAGTSLDVLYRPGGRVNSGSRAVPLRWHGDWKELADSLPNKLDVAERAGLRVVSRQPNHAGWVTCRSIFRDDRNPSARFSLQTGNYWEAGLPRTINLFGLLVELGAYPDFNTAAIDLEVTTMRRTA